MANIKPRVVAVDVENAEGYLNALKKNNLKAEEVVFPFPTDIAHVSKKTKLHDRYTAKKEVQHGLANVADILSDLKVATWNMPLEGVAVANEEATVHGGLNKLWELLGYGYNLAMPSQKAWVSSSPANLVVDAVYKQQFMLMTDFANSEHQDPAAMVDAENRPLINETFIAAFKKGQSLKQAELDIADNLAHLNEIGGAKLHEEQIEDAAPAPEAVKNAHFKQLLAKQESARAWRTAAAVIFSILSVGLLAIPLYNWWRNKKDAENIQAVKMKPVDFQLV